MMASLMTTRPAIVAYLPMHGPYTQVPEGFGRLYAWTEAHGYKAAGPPMERYLNDPGEAHPDEYLTEVQLPVRRA